MTNEAVCFAGQTMQVAVVQRLQIGVLAARFLVRIIRLDSSISGHHFEGARLFLDRKQLLVRTKAQTIEIQDQRLLLFVAIFFVIRLRC